VYDKESFMGLGDDVFPPRTLRGILHGEDKDFTRVSVNGQPYIKADLEFSLEPLFRAETNPLNGDDIIESVILLLTFRETTADAAFCGIDNIGFGPKK
jgi:hypothetical protein